MFIANVQSVEKTLGWVVSSEKVAENFGSAIENLSSNYSAKQKDANAPERHEIKYVLEVHCLQKNCRPLCQKVGI